MRYTSVIEYLLTKLISEHSSVLGPDRVAHGIASELVDGDGERLADDNPDVLLLGGRGAVLGRRVKVEAHLLAHHVVLGNLRIKIKC